MRWYNQIRTAKFIILFSLSLSNYPQHNIIFMECIKDLFKNIEEATPLILYPHDKIVYVLQLEGGRLYVGRSTKYGLEKRLLDHINQTSRSSVLTRKYKVTKIRYDLFRQNCSIFEEDKIVKQLMAKYGFDRVGGGAYSQQFGPTQQQRIFIDHQITAASDKCYYCKKYGHFAKYCPQKQLFKKYRKRNNRNQQNPQQRFQIQESNKQINMLREEIIRLQLQKEQLQESIKQVQRDSHRQLQIQKSRAKDAQNSSRIAINKLKEFEDSKKKQTEKLESLFKNIIKSQRKKYEQKLQMTHQKLISCESEKRILLHLIQRREQRFSKMEREFEIYYRQKQGIQIS